MQCSRIWVVFVLRIISLLIRPTLAVKCVTKSPCYCEFDDGSGVVNITELGRTDGEPAFKDYKADAPDSYLYSYNPCYAFDEASCSTDCAVCQVSDDVSFIAGQQKTAEFTMAGQNLQVTYTAEDRGANRTSVVKLICNPNVTAEFKAQGQRQRYTPPTYDFTLTTKCACPNGCKWSPPPAEPGISIGTILLIIFFVIILVYLVGGILFMKYHRKAQGREVIPNDEFWASLPALIKDGVLFTISPCRKSAYQKI